MVTSEIKKWIPAYFVEIKNSNLSNAQVENGKWNVLLVKLYYFYHAF